MTRRVFHCNNTVCLLRPSSQWVCVRAKEANTWRVIHLFPMLSGKELCNALEPSEQLANVFRTLERLERKWSAPVWWSALSKATGARARESRSCATLAMSSCSLNVRSVHVHDDLQYMINVCMSYNSCCLSAVFDNFSRESTESPSVICECTLSGLRLSY